ncbi:MAG: hypothetical protein QME45_04605 [Clostridiales bacterium]|nr:hypothetical protein [Clostridiales bacterium]
MKYTRYTRKTKLSGIIIVCVIVLVVNSAIIKIMPTFKLYNEKNFAGAVLTEEDYSEYAGIEDQGIKPDDDYIERFLRPSASAPLEKKYYIENVKYNIPQKFQSPDEIVRAYFDILGDASYMGDKKGGCGSIGLGNTPYPKAYELLSDDFKKNMPYDKFFKSFKGIGHINLLKLIDAPAIKIDNRIGAQTFVEIETIEGTDSAGKTSFCYYYGFITALDDKSKGWKINSIQLKSEDFLCHAYHGWNHEASAIVSIIYGKQLGIISTITGIEENGYFRNVSARSKDGKQYRFQFVRITNGADIELRQSVMQDGKWKDIEISKKQ